MGKARYALGRLRHLCYEMSFIYGAVLCCVLCVAVLQLVDLGCGYGGTAVHIAQKLKCKAVGVNISPFQVRGSKWRVQVLRGYYQPGEGGGGG